MYLFCFISETQIIYLKNVHINFSVKNSVLLISCQNIGFSAALIINIIIVVLFIFKKKLFLVWFQNRLISSGLEPVLSPIEKS